METPHSEIHGSEALISAFGYWPHFHDAEVLEFNLTRGNLDPEADSWEFPCIHSLIHVFEMTNEVTSGGYFVLAKHHLVRFRFDGIDELQLEGFNHQNVLYGLDINPIDNGPQRFQVIFDSAFGADAKFNCQAISITEVLPCTAKGSPCA